MKNNKKSINILDLVIVLVLICSVTGVIYNGYSASSPGGSEKLTKAQVTLTIHGAKSDFRNILEPGQKVYFEENGLLFGKINNIFKKTQKTYVVDENDTLSAKYNPYNLDITISLDAKIYKDVNGHFKTSGGILIPGKTISLYTTNFQFDAVVIEVQEDTDN